MEFRNPIAFPSIQEMLLAILNVVMIIATPVVVFFIIFAGFTYVTARGNPEKIQQATKALTYGVIGGVIIVGSLAIMTIMGDIVTSFNS